MFSWIFCISDRSTVKVTGLAEKLPVLVSGHGLVCQLGISLVLAKTLSIHYYRVSKNVLYPKMQNFKNFYYNKDNRIWYLDLFKR